MIPNPGSDKAIKLGCRCPRMDNNYGEGFGNPRKFWITDGCPLHAPKKEEEDAKARPD